MIGLGNFTTIVYEWSVILLVRMNLLEMNHIYKKPNGILKVGLHNPGQKQARERAWDDHSTANRIIYSVLSQLSKIFNPRRIIFDFISKYSKVTWRVYRKPR